MMRVDQLERKLAQASLLRTAGRVAVVIGRVGAQGRALGAQHAHCVICSLRDVADERRPSIRQGLQVLQPEVNVPHWNIYRVADRGRPSKRDVGDLLGLCRLRYRVVTGKAVDVDRKGKTKHTPLS
jgi:hypothetical protein